MQPAHTYIDCKLHVRIYIYIYTKLILILHTVPGAINSLSAIPSVISMLVTWNKPLMPNGIITGYSISYHQLGEENSLVVNVTETSFKLTGLHPNTIYNISVSAYTVIGPGPAVAVQETTLNLRKHSIIICKHKSNIS